MTSIPYEIEEKKTQEEVHVAMETEIEALWPQAMKSRRQKTQEGFPLSLQREHGPADSSFQTLASRPMGEYISVVLNLLSAVICCSSHRKLGQRPMGIKIYLNFLFKIHNIKTH